MHRSQTAQNIPVRNYQLGFNANYRKVLVLGLLPAVRLPQDQPIGSFQAEAQHRQGHTSPNDECGGVAIVTLEEPRDWGLRVNED